MSNLSNYDYLTRTDARNPSYDLTDWSPREVGKIMLAEANPVYFCEEPLFLGQKLFPMQSAIMEEFYRDNYRELVLISGRQSGKTHLASCFGLYETFKLLIQDDPAAAYGLAPGSRIFVMTVAVSEKQARDGIFSQITSKMSRSPFFRSFNPQIYSLEVRFPTKNVVLFCGTSSSSSNVGRTVKCVIFDELDMFDDTDSKRGAENVYYTMSRSTVAFGNAGKRLSISSAMHTDGMMTKLEKTAKDVDDTLSYRYATWEFNPNISFDSKDMQNELERDPETFWRDYGSRPVESTEKYFGNSDILYMTGQPNIIPRILDSPSYRPPPHPYVLSGDPALKHDGFGLALSRMDGENFYVDGLYNFKADPRKGVLELSPLNIKNTIKKVAKGAGVIAAVFDTWMFPEMQEEIQMMGIPVYNHIVRKEDYDAVKELFYTQKLNICDFPEVMDEFKDLRLIRGKKVDHPKSGSKDVSDSVANSIWLLREVMGEIKLPPLISGVSV